MSSLQKQFQDLRNEFIDDYIDEWIKPGNDLIELHRIGDNFVNALIQAVEAFIVEDKEAKNTLTYEAYLGYQIAIEDFKKNMGIV